MNKKLVKIPLQFFGEPEDQEDFGDDFDDYEEDELGGGDYAEDAEDDTADPEEEENDNEDGGTDDGADPDTNTDNEDSDLIAELRALGYVGDDLASLTSDLKAKREAKEAAEKSKSRKADLAASKAHVKSSKPSQSANGDATGGFTERQVTSFAEVAGCSKEEARKLLREQIKLMT